MQAQFTSVEPSILESAGVSGMYAVQRPPITLCANGHNICNIYKHNIPHCPTCRQPLLYTRNVTLEKLATEMMYPCVYRMYGCKEIHSFYLIGGHQEKCQYIPLTCLLHKLSLVNCTRTGTVNDADTPEADAH